MSVTNLLRLTEGLQVLIQYSTFAANVEETTSHIEEILMQLYQELLRNSLFEPKQLFQNLNKSPRKSAKLFPV
jgi:hypothetical protein